MHKIILHASEDIVLGVLEQRSFDSIIAADCPSLKEFKFIYPRNQTDSELFRLPVSASLYEHTASLHLIATMSQYSYRIGLHMELQM